MNEKKLQYWINENREKIDEFLGPNNVMYTTIGLKGQLASELGKHEAFRYFEYLMNSKMSQITQNNFMRELLIDIRDSKKHTKNSNDPLMRFGKNTKFLIYPEKNEFLEILISEFL